MAETELARRERDRALFVAANVFMGLGVCVNASAFNNYLREVYALNVAQRTFLELPRELPGFLVSLFVGILASLGDVRTAAIANLTASAGMLALGWIPVSYGLMLASVFVLSSGHHVCMPLGHSIGMSFAAEGREGATLGRFQSANTAALVAGSATLLLLFKFAGLSYRAAFSAGSFFQLCAAATLFAMRGGRRSAAQGRRFVVRREYGRYYVLSVLYGARKQLFLTFGPWMLVDFFKQPVSTMTLLFLVISCLGIYTKPLVGRLTDRFGVRAVLSSEALITIGACALYALAPELLPPGPALLVVSACYIFDQASDAVGMTRAVYVKKICLDPADVSPTLSLGLSIDHVVSMTVPMLGGIAWRSSGGHGYRWIFLTGAVVAALNFLLTKGIRIDGDLSRPGGAAHADRPYS